jgi:hypothetical protein
MTERFIVDVVLFCVCHEAGHLFLFPCHKKVYPDFFQAMYQSNQSQSTWAVTIFAARSVDGRGLVSDISVEERNGKTFWAIKAPGKMKIPLWRAAHDTAFPLVFNTA